MRLGKLWGSPLAIVVAGVAVASLWTLGYGATTSSADASPTTPAAIDESGVLAAIRSRQRMGPKLLRPPPNDVLGLDIAIEDRDGTSMAALHRDLARAAAGEGQARLAFYGASHVAGDIFTGYIRRELQARFGDAGHGFLVPVHPWRTYRHRDINIESDGKQWETQRIRVGDSEVERVGLAGIAMMSKRPGSFGAVYTAQEGDYGRTAGFFELYYLKHPRGGDMDVLIERGCTSFKLFMAYPGVFYSDDGEILRAMQKAAETDSLIMMHAENGMAIDVLREQALARGDTDPVYHGLTRPALTESEATHRAIVLAELAGAHLYVVHMSAKEAVAEIAEARDRGLPVFAETCPQYLFLSLEEHLAAEGFEGAKYVCSTPIRKESEGHQEALWRGLATNDLQVVSTDLCPFCIDDHPVLGTQKKLGLGDFTAIPKIGRAHV